MLAIFREQLSSSMSVGKPILSRLSGIEVKGRFAAPSRLGGVFCALGLAVSLSASAKDASSVAIVLFDGPKGAAYIQVTGITLNGKTELRICDGVPKMDKSAYNALPRAQLSGAASLARGADGVLKLTVDAKPMCVVPANLKFDKSPELTPAEAAEQAVLRGIPVSSSLTDPALPAFKAGVQLVFIAAPDSELADYLRAQRANSIDDWQEFLLRYPASIRAASARNSMAGIHERAAEAAFSQYEKLAASGQHDPALLKRAYAGAQA